MTTTESTRVAGQIHRSTSTDPLIADRDLPRGEHFIGGRFRPGSGHERLPVIDPCTEELICEVPRGTVADVDAAVAAAVEAAPGWGRATPKDRSDALHAIADRMAQHHDLLVALEALNTGKPIEVAEDDMTFGVDVLRFMAGAVRGTTTLASGEYSPGHLSLAQREPLGPVGVITPWNYPLLMAIWKIGPALAAGDTMVLKPSEQTPLTTLKFAELTADLLPPGVLNIVTGEGPVVGDRLAAHPELAMVALTGSVRAGRSVARTAADTGKRVHLELGGKAPVLVFPDSDLAATAQGVREAGFWNSGQECGAACRVLVHESVAEEFTELLTAEVSALTVGEPGAGPDIEVGPMVSAQHYERVLAHLEQAKADGARIAAGGGALDGAGFFVAPTVLADVPPRAACTREEIFGPVVSVETFTDEEEAVDRANDTPYGLSASVWTRDAQRSQDIASRLDAGTVWVNCHLELAAEMPWGGFKGSGYGRDLSVYALDDFSRVKHVMHRTERD